MTQTVTADPADARFWDRHARKYAASAIKDQAGYDRTIDRTRELLKPTDQALEIGCGTGTTALKLASSVAHLLATDISSGMIAIAQEKASAQACGNVTFRVAEAYAPVAQPDALDAVLAFNVLHLLQDHRQAMAAAREMLKPGGLFISKTTCLAEMNKLIRIAVPMMQAIGKAPHVAFFRADDLLADIAAAGFEIVEAARHGSGRTDPRIFIVARKI